VVLQQLRVQVNGNTYDTEIISRNKAKVNGIAVDLEAPDDDAEEEESITIDGKKFFLDFAEGGEPCLMIINGMSYIISKRSSLHQGPSSKELRAPINGQITKVFVNARGEVTENQLLITLEAMKMENQIKSPLKGRIKEVRVKSGQTVRSGEILLLFE
jgi:biotin carboxyl carrier protein